MTLPEFCGGLPKERIGRWKAGRNKRSLKYHDRQFFCVRIILLFDAHKLDISDEFKNAIQVKDNWRLSGGSRMCLRI